MNETALILAVLFASAIGSPLVEGIKMFYNLVMKKPLEDMAAFYVAVATSIILGLLAVVAAGGFAPPFPTEWTEWAIRIGGTIGTIFACMAAVFRALIKQAKAK